MLKYIRNGLVSNPKYIWLETIKHELAKAPTKDRVGVETSDLNNTHHFVEFLQKLYPEMQRKSWRVANMGYEEVPAALTNSNGEEFYY